MGALQGQNGPHVGLKGVLHDPWPGLQERDLTAGVASKDQVGTVCSLSPAQGTILRNKTERNEPELFINMF